MRQTQYTKATNADLIRRLFWNGVTDGQQNQTTKGRDKEEKAIVIELLRRLGETATPDQLIDILE